MHYIGIDCAKSTFEIALSAHKGSQVLKLDNTYEGFEQLLYRLPTDGHCVMKATGPYSYPLATFLYEKQIPVSVVNPL